MTYRLSTTLDRPFADVASENDRRALAHFCERPVEVGAEFGIGGGRGIGNAAGLTHDSSFKVRSKRRTISSSSSAAPAW